MGNKPCIRHYFAEGITNRGYISLLPNMMSDWNKVYVLMGGPGMGKSTLIKVLGIELQDRGFEVDLLRSARDPDAIAGIILRRLNIGILNMHEVAPLRFRVPGVIEGFYDFTQFCDSQKLKQERGRLIELERENEMVKQRIGEILAEDFGGRIREKPCWNIGQCDEDRPWLKNAIGLIKENKVPWSKVEHAMKKLQKSVVSSFFLHGIDTEGWVNLAPRYLMDFDQIRLDREETSEAMDWIVQETEYLGQVIDIILHPLYPDEIIGVAFPMRKLAIWQGDPEQISQQGLEKNFGERLKAALKEAQNLKKQIKIIYTDAIDFDKVDMLKDELLNIILKDIDEFIGIHK